MISKLKRGALRRSFTRTFNELKEELNKGTDADDINTKRLIRQLEDRFSQLEKADETIMQELIEQDIGEDEMNEEVDTRQEYRDKMNDITASFEHLYRREDMPPINVPCRDEINPTNVSYSGEVRTRYKLPKLELVQFDGEPKNWLNFWSQFKGIHENDNVSSEEIFQYLIQATVVDSPARSVVASFPPTSENYPKAIKYLKTRFGKDS